MAGLLVVQRKIKLNIHVKLNIRKMTFNELHTDRQLDIVSDCLNSMNNPLEHIIEQVTTELNEYGFQDVNVMYAGFGSQGDGASFTSDSIDISIFMLNHFYHVSM